MTYTKSPVVIVISNVEERIVVRQVSEYLARTAFFLNFNPNLEGIIRQSELYFLFCPPFLSKWMFRFLPFLMLVSRLTLSILLDRLSISYKKSRLAFDWVQSCIIGHTQTVHYGGLVLKLALLRSGIPQRSELGQYSAIVLMSSSS